MNRKKNSLYDDSFCFPRIIREVFFRVDTHRLKDQVVVVEPADEKLKAELEKEVGQGPGFAD